MTRDRDHEAWLGITPTPRIHSVVGVGGVIPDGRKLRLLLVAEGLGLVVSVLCLRMGLMAIIKKKEKHKYTKDTFDKTENIENQKIFELSIDFLSQLFCLNAIQITPIKVVKLTHCRNRKEQPFFYLFPVNKARHNCLIAMYLE